MMFKVILKSFLLLILLLLNTEILFPQTSFHFLNIDPSARASALGSCGSAINGINAINQNPAGLALTDNMAIMISDLQWLSDYQYLNLIYGQNIFYGGCAVSLSYFAPSDFELYDSNGESAGSILNKKDLALTLGYGQQILMHLYSGLSIKYIQSRIMDDTFTALALDMGIKYNFHGFNLINQPDRHNTSFSICLKNIGYNFSAYEKKDHLPLNLITGISYTIYKHKVHDIRIQLENEYNIFDKKIFPAMGLEYWLFNTIALRTGYQFNDEIKSLSIGLGSRYLIKNFNSTLDFSYVPAAYNEKIINFSLGIELRPGQKKNKQEISVNINKSTNELMVNIHDKNALLFQKNTSTFKPKAEKTLTQIVSTIKEVEYKKVIIIVYLDNNEDPGQQQNLSHDRANKISQFLISKGIKKSRIVFKSLDEQPTAINNTTGIIERTAAKKYGFQILIIKWNKEDKKIFDYYYFSGMDAFIKEGYQLAIEEWQKALEMDQSNQEITDLIKRAQKQLVLKADKIY